MASSGPSGQLTNNQIVELGAAIPADNMEAIAQGYMDIDPATIQNIKRDTGNSEAFTRKIIEHWTYKNPTNQVQVC